MMFQFKKSKVLTVWFWSYLSVVMLPIVISLLSYSIYFKNFREQNDAFNTYIANFTTNHIKENMVDIRRMYADVTSHEQVLSVLRITEPSDYLKNKDALSFLSYLERIVLYRNEDSNFFLYIPETETVLSSSGAVESQTYFEAYFGGGEEAFESWKATLQNQEVGFFFHELYSEKSNKTFIEYCSVMPSSIRQYGYRAVFCALTEKSTFFQKTEEVDWLKSASVYIFNAKDELLLDSAGNPNTPRTLHGLLEELSGSRAVLSRHLDFDNSVLNIVLVTDENNLLLQVISMRRLFLFSTALVTIASLFLSVWVVKRNYRPIEDILTTMGAQSNGDEFTEIKQFVKSSQINEEKWKSELRQNCLTHLVKGTFPRYYLWSDLKKAGIVFRKKAFFILLISVENLEGYAEESRESLQKRFNELTFMITNVYEELFNNENTKSYVINIDNYFVCVINTDLTYENNIQTLLQRADLGASVLNREYQLGLKFALSKAHGSESELPEAYTETFYALNLCQFKEMNSDLSSHGSSFFQSTDENQELDAKNDLDYIMEYIYQNYRNEDLNITFLSEHFEISSYYLSKRFKSVYGESLIDFIHNLRLVEAKTLIRNGEKTMLQIAQSVGYTNIRTFNRVFKKYEGITPTQYQQQNERENGV